MGRRYGDTHRGPTTSIHFDMAHIWDTFIRTHMGHMYGDTHRGPATRHQNPWVSLSLSGLAQAALKKKKCQGLMIEKAD